MASSGISSVHGSPSGDLAPRRRIRTSLFTILALAGLTAAAPSLQAQETSPFQLSLFPPIQISPEGHQIVGLRLSLIYGKNVSVNGLDIGLVSHSTGEGSVGVQFGGIGYVEGDFVGWQASEINVVAGRFTGFQSGLYNQAGSTDALQLGLVNRTGSASGLQIGLVNFAEESTGFQIGLLNIIRDNPSHPVLPIINWGN